MWGNLAAVQEHTATTILLIRHGRTAWNEQRIFRGRADVPLSPEGSRQAAALAERLAGDALSAVYTSPLSRARVTAEHVAEVHALEVQPGCAGCCAAPRDLEGLRDIGYGAWEGIPEDQVQERWPDLYAKWRSAPHLVRPPGGETLAEVRERALGALGEIAARHAGSTLAAVSHRVVNKVLLCAALGLGDDAFWRIRQDTACLNALTSENGRLAVVVMNDTCHLRGLEKDASDF
jgi:broad specificity phosphatase PhoE